MALRTTLVSGNYVSGNWSKLNNELHDMYWVRWERHVARSGRIKMHKGFWWGNLKERGQCVQKIINRPQTQMWDIR